MDDLNTTLIQDAAAMYVKYPNRRNHPLFDLKVFRSIQFKVRTIFVREIMWVFSGSLVGFWLFFCLIFSPRPAFHQDNGRYTGQNGIPQPLGRYPRECYPWNERSVHVHRGKRQ